MTTTPQDAMKKFPVVPHHEISEVFADTIGSTFFDGNTLRLEFTVARMQELKPPAPPTGERHTVCRLVLSAPCAMDLINQMQQITTQLVQAGLIKLEKGQAEPTHGKTN